MPGPNPNLPVESACQIKRFIFRGNVNPWILIPVFFDMPIICIPLEFQFPFSLFWNHASTTFRYFSWMRPRYIRPISYRLPNTPWNGVTSYICNLNFLIQSMAVIPWKNGGLKWSISLCPPLCQTARNAFSHYYSKYPGINTEPFLYSIWVIRTISK